MKKILFSASILVMALAGFFATAFVMRRTQTAPEPSPKAHAPVKPKTIDPAAQKRIDALRQRVRDLEAMIAAKAANAAREEAEKTPEGTGKVPRLEMTMRHSRGQVSTAQYMDWLERNDPAFFVSHTNGVAVSQQRAITVGQMRLDLFSRLDESRLDAESLAAHRECMAVCEELKRLAEIQKDPYLELDVLRKLSQEKNGLESRLEELYLHERQSLVRQYVRELGCVDDDQVEQTILEIMDNTTGDVIHGD